MQIHVTIDDHKLF